jgi:hypothetical protein
VTPDADNPYEGGGALSQRMGILWADRDPQGFADWIESQPTPEKRAQGAQMMIGHLMNDQDYAEAAEWAGSMGEGEHSNNMLMNVVANWVSADREAARAWFAQAKLPEQTRENLKGYFPQSER